MWMSRDVQPVSNGPFGGGGGGGEGSQRPCDQPVHQAICRPRPGPRVCSPQSCQRNSEHFQDRASVMLSAPSSTHLKIHPRYRANGFRNILLTYLPGYRYPGLTPQGDPPSFPHLWRHMRLILDGAGGTGWAGTALMAWERIWG